MGYLITVSPTGDIVSKKHKGRGRAPKTAIKKEDGNYYIYQEEPKEIIEEEIQPIEDEEGEVVPTDTITTKIKTYKVKADQSVAYSDICGCLHKFKILTENEDFAVYLGPIVLGNLNLPILEFNSLFSKIEINRRENKIYIWNMSPEGPPQIVLLGAIKEQD